MLIDSVIDYDPPEQKHTLVKQNVLDCGISAGNFKTTLTQVVGLASRKQSSYVCFANVHMLYEANHDNTFKSVLNKADIVCPDGKPVSVLMRALSKTEQERVCGMDFMPASLAEAEKLGLKVFFYGSTVEVLQSIESKIKADLPSLAIAGMYSPPFRPLSVEEDKKVIDMINSSGAHLVYVSLGCPKQERWMNEHKGKVSACMLGVGQAFNTFSGLEKRLPKPVRNLGLEWLYRLCIEPKRLFKRYFTSNTWFLWKCVKTAKFH